MPLLLNFRDAVNPSVLDPKALWAVFYMDGHYENEAAVRAQCPHAKLFAITTQGATGHGIFACDSETYDLTVAQTMAWNAEQFRLGVSPICDYADEDRWENQGLLAEVQAFEKAHDMTIEKWDADYDGSSDLPAWASAKQYATGDVDLDVARANFFASATPVPAKPVAPHGTARLELACDLADGAWTHHGLPGHPHWGPDEQWASVEVQVCRGGARKGQWRVKALSPNAAPLGG